MDACNFIEKENLAKVFSCQFCEISKNSFFIEHLWCLLLELNVTVAQTKGAAIILNTEIRVSKGTFSCTLEVFENHSFLHNNIETKVLRYQKKRVIS